MSTNNIMKSPIVLQLNGNWMPIAQKTVAEAVIAMTSQGESPAALALDIAYDKDENGEYDFSSPTYMNPVGWNEWMTLPVREYDLAIRTVNTEIRVPTVLIATKFRKMPVKKPRATKFNVFERDRGICAYTGKKVSRGQGNIDHIIPRSRGGKNTWENMVWCDKDINSKKGDKLPHEVGLKLLTKPIAPAEIPVSMTFREAKRPEWIPFIHAS